MEHHLTAGVRKVDAPLSALGKRGEVSNVPMERAQPGSLGHAGVSGRARAAGRDPVEWWCSGRGELAGSPASLPSLAYG